MTEVAPSRARAARRRAGPLAALAAAAAKFGGALKALVLIAKFKTALTMLVAVALYAWVFGWPFAVGFVLLIFVHEMGHVVALRAKGIPASAPMFVPFLGAFVNMKQPPRHVHDEATTAFAGPLAGTLAAGVTFYAWHATGSSLLQALAYTGFWLNLFNLLPVLPLDGGRVAAALHPAMWGVGLAGIAAMLLWHFNPLLLLIVVLGGFEMVRRWRTRGRDAAYYQLPARARLAVAAAYVGLIAVLLVGMHASYLHPHVGVGYFN